MQLSRTRTFLSSPTTARILAVSGFAALTALSARATLELPFTPIPLTFQVLVVLLAGLALGPLDGAASQLAYLAAIAAGLPLDARMLGPAVWAAPTAGYLIGFIPCAYAAGWVAERLRGRVRGGDLLGGAAGILALYLIGASWLTFGFLRGDLAKGIAAGVAPFLLLDLLKAAAAGLLSGSARGAFRALTGGR